MSSNVKFEWTKIKQDDYNEINHIVVCDNLLIYPYFNEEFKIHTDSGKIQLGAVIG